MRFSVATVIFSLLAVAMAAPLITVRQSGDEIVQVGDESKPKTTMNGELRDYVNTDQTAPALGTK
ncbi:hypothetical protein M501DRAFT_1019447 [Patellaria atrata CBS 101060]|uniref:RxLR effector protein n=1 Tax=Patellaria atrata CBS 101060 TaxID=1346257 RepID=A0A9P4VN30_9PEZI|nr:hypothetical protein M501DRAFT_1019447 [Patellaria atrata CBS 101060]